LQHKPIFDGLLSNNRGSTVPRVLKTDITGMQLKLPTYPKQKSIASILSALDNKIELNLQMNKTLEEMAMALYKHWFVDFGPFQDGEFIDSELGEIPKGWEVKQLKYFALLIMGQSPKSEFYNDSKEGLPFHQGVKDYGIRFPTDITYSTVGNREAAKGDILFSVRAPVGRLNVAKNKIILGRGLAAIRMPKFNSFLFYALKRMFVTEDSIGSGTVFNSVNKSDLQNLKFVLPPENQLLNFKELVDPLDKQYLNNSTENQTLTQLRDTLLPKLISGEVRVKDAEKTLTEVL
jgi:type I restriction enzyme S subunit